MSIIRDLKLNMQLTCWKILAIPGLEHKPYCILHRKTEQKLNPYSENVQVIQCKTYQTNPRPYVILIIICRGISKAFIINNSYVLSKVLVRDIDYPSIQIFKWNGFVFYSNTFIPRIDWDYSSYTLFIKNIPCSIVCIGIY